MAPDLVVARGISTEHGVPVPRPISDGLVSRKYKTENRAGWRGGDGDGARAESVRAKAVCGGGGGDRPRAYGVEFLFLHLSG
jgi:hypothetical protein